MYKISHTGLNTTVLATICFSLWLWMREGWPGKEEIKVYKLQAGNLPNRYKKDKKYGGISGPSVSCSRHALWDQMQK